MAKHKLTAEEKKIIQTMKRTSKGAEKKAKDAEPNIRGQQLPGGITNGIAQFTKFKIDIGKNKYPYVMLTGIVVQPEEHKGARAQVSHFLSPPKSKLGKSLPEKWERLFSDLQILGINTHEMDQDDVLPEVFMALKDLAEEKPLFTFNTWRPSGEDSDTMVFIQKLLSEDEAESYSEGDMYAEDDEAEEDEEEEDEETEDDDEEEGEEEDDEAEEEDEETEEEEDDEETDDESDEDESEEDDEEEDEDWAPEKGEVYGYRINSKSSPFPCEVTSVSVKKETVNLKRQKDGKEFKAKSWDSLEDYEA